MSKNQVQVRIDEKLKTEATEILNNLGLDLSSAVRLFLNRVVIEQGLPFKMSLPLVSETSVSNEIDSISKNMFDPVSYLDDYILTHKIGVN
ncbi:MULTISPECIES: type II toxin-antitoxin system RelB/DinJ family antitoxin [Treponema]|uniref:type II toxin-antitoxin system RelB/DinJ family antitoxin n=1 Tax=Treponema TaxID=157 RepID=UPI003FD8F4E4